MAHCDAAGVNGSDRIRSHGAPPSRMMPNGCLGSPVIVLLFGLDRGFLMDVGPTRAENRGLGARVSGTKAENASTQIHLDVTDPSVQELTMRRAAVYGPHPSHDLLGGSEKSHLKHNWERVCQPICESLTLRSFLE